MTENFLELVKMVKVGKIMDSKGAIKELSSNTFFFLVGNFVPNFYKFQCFEYIFRINKHKISFIYTILYTY